MRLFICSILFLSFTASFFSAVAQEVGPLVKSKTIYKKALEKIEADYQADIKPVNDKYHKNLTKMLAQANQTGNLEIILHIKVEIKRFLKTKNVPSPPASDLHTLIIKAHDGYKRAVADAEKDRDVRVINLLSQYIKRLDGLKKEYVKDANLKSASIVAKELDKAKAEYRVTRSMIVEPVVKPASIVSRKVRSSLRPSLPSSLLEGLVLYYDFDRDNGKKVFDRSGSKNHGIVHDAQWTPQGKIGGAYKFTQKESAIISGKNLGIIGNAPRTATLWIKAEEASYNATLLGLGSFVKGGAWILMMNANNQLKLWAHKADLKSSSLGEIRGEWHHFAVVYDGEIGGFYFNGEPLIEKKGRKWDTADTPLCVGSTQHLIQKNDWQDSMIGTIDEVMIYNRALSDSEIQQLYKETNKK